MKKIITTTLLTALTATLPLITVAEYQPQVVEFDPGRNVERNSGLGNATPGDVAGGIINWILGLLMLLAVSLVIYGGILWMTAAGKEDQVTKAKDILIGALIGIVIILASYGTTLYVFENLINATQ